MCYISKLSTMPRHKVEQILSELYLTDDEFQIIEMYLTGKSNQQIAQRLCMSERTVCRRKQNISKKIAFLS